MIAGVPARISKARGAYAALSNVLGILLYGAESWKVTKAISNKIYTFQNSCLYILLRIFWPNTITNEKFYTRTNTNHLSQVLSKRMWQWMNMYVECTHLLYQGLPLGGYQLESGRDEDHKRPGEDRWGKEEMRTTGHGHRFKDTNIGMPGNGLLC